MFPPENNFSRRPILLTTLLVLLFVLLLQTTPTTHPGTRLNPELVIKSSQTKQTSVAIAGSKTPVQWTTLIKKSDISSNSYLTKLPKHATNIKIQTISANNAKIVLSAKVPTATLAMSDRRTLALRKPSPANSWLGSLSDAAESITSALGGPASGGDPVIVDLSEQIPSGQPVDPITPELATDSADMNSIATDSGDTTNYSLPTTNSSDFVSVTYETPAPTITEEETSTGKTVTVSDPSETQTPTTDVLAFTNIPEIYKLGQEDKIKIKWKNNGDQPVEFHAYDLNNNGKLDYVEWTVPHLSDQVFEIIFISKAWHLDSNLEILEDIYDTVATQDSVYATVPQNDFVRVTFEQVLDNTKDITIYAKPTESGLPSAIEVYPVYIDEQGNQTQGPKLDLVSDNENPDFTNITEDGKYRILLTNLQTPTDVFDLKIVSTDYSLPTTNSLDIDYIVDPSYTIVEGNSSGHLVSNNQRKIVRTSNGDLHAVHYRSDGSYNQIYYSKSVDGGANWVETEIVNENYNQQNPSIAVDSNDYIHVVWGGKDVSSPTYYQIRYIKYTTSWSSITDLTSENYSQTNPFIAVDSNDYIHVVWNGKDASSTSRDQIRYIKYTTSWSSITDLTSENYTQTEAPSIAVDSNNYIHVVWGGKDDNYPSYNQIRYIKYTTSWSSITDLTSDADYIQSKPSIAVDSNNYIHVVWMGTYASFPTYYQIRYIKYTTSWSSITDLTSDADYTQSRPSIAVDLNDYIHVVWSGLDASFPTYSQIRYIKYTTSWSSITDLTNSISTYQDYASAVWSLYPTVNGLKTNRPKNGYAFIWMNNITISYYSSSDLAWDAPANTAPTLTSVATSPATVKGGSTITITPTGQADADSNDLYYYCNETGTAGGQAPTSANTLCTQEPTAYASANYSTMTCSYSADTGNATRNVYCRAYDSTEYSSEVTATYIVDSTSPTTTISSTNNANNITSTLTCNDGSATTYYCTDTTNTCTPTTVYTTPVTYPITQTTYFRYYSTDTAGNQSSTGSDRVSAIEGQASEPAPVPAQTEDEIASSPSAPRNDGEQARNDDPITQIKQQIIELITQLVGLFAEQVSQMGK